MKAFMKRALLFLLLAMLPQVALLAEAPDSMVLSINDAYKALKASHTTAAQKAFFDVFPSSPRRLAFIEDYIVEAGKEDIDFHGWLEAFGNVPAIDDSTYCDKLLRLSIGAQLDADGFNFLHALLHEKLGCVACCGRAGGHVPGMMQELLRQLSHRTKGEQMRFWQFYFSSLWHEEDHHSIDHSHDAELERVMNAAGRNTDMGRTIRLAFEYSSNEVVFMSGD